MNWSQIASIGMPVWRDAKDVCALADSDRHLGHIVNQGDWHAFDAVHPNDAGDGFRHVGVFATAEQAKAAVERSVSQPVAAKAKRRASVTRTS